MPRNMYIIVKPAPACLDGGTLVTGTPPEQFPEPGFYWHEEDKILYYVNRPSAGSSPSNPVINSMWMYSRPPFNEEAPGSSNIDIHLLLDQLIDLGGRQRGGREGA